MIQANCASKKRDINMCLGCSITINHNYVVYQSLESSKNNAMVAFNVLDL